MPARKLVVFPNDPLSSYYAKGEIKERYFNPGNIFDEIHVLSPAANDISPQKVKQLAGKAKFRIHPIGRILSIRNPFLFFAQRKRVYAIVSGIQPDIIRAFNPVLQGYFATSCAKHLGIPSVISVHGNYGEMRFFPFTYYGLLGVIKNFRSIFFKQIIFCFLSKLLEKNVLSNCTVTICVSKFLSLYARKHGAKNISVIYNRVNTRVFHKGKPRKSKKRPIILCVGRVGVQKNQECLIRAIKGLDVGLLLIGQPDMRDGGYLHHLKRLVKELGLGDNVHFIPAVPHKSISRYYRQADIFAIATRWEGFCIPVLEAMAASLPVVAPDKEPLPEVLGGTGMLVENNPEAFREVFMRLLNSPSLRKRLGAKARRRAKSLDGKYMEAKEYKLYETLTKNGKQKEA